MTTSRFGKHPSLVLIGLAAAIVASAAAAQAPDYVVLRNVSYAGAGCPAGSVFVDVAEDYRALDLVLEAMKPERGPGLPPAAQRKNCQLAIDLAHPAGWSYALWGGSVRGDESIGPRASLVHRIAQYYSGSPATLAYTATLRGPHEGEYEVPLTSGRGHDPRVPNVDGALWSPCGSKRGLTLNAQSIHTGPLPRSGVIRIPSFDEGIRVRLGLIWRRCS